MSLYETRADGELVQPDDEEVVLKQTNAPKPSFSRA